MLPRRVTHGVTPGVPMEDMTGPDGPSGTPSAAVPPTRTTGTANETLRRYDHDIRAAMSDILGGLRLIDMSRLDAETRVQVERVAAAGDTLAALLEGVFLAASGDATDVAGRRDVPLGDLIGGWRKRWSGRAQALGVPFEMRMDLPDEMLTWRVPAPLDRVVANLAENALVHGDGTPVRLSVDAGADGTLGVAVADGGRGLDSDAPLRRDRAGHGYGLGIVRDLARDIGATLTITRGAPLGGTCVRLDLPAARMSRAGPFPDAPAPDLSDLSILVAEDNASNRAILGQILGALNARPVFVADGAEALAALSETRFDIALIDIEMPNVSGLEVMETVRARADSTASMPLVALTAYVLRDNREAIYAAGADGVIGKPVSSVEEFGRTILRYAGRPAGLPEPEDVLGRDSEDPAFGAKMDEGRFHALLEVAGADDAIVLLERLDEDLRAVRDSLDTGVQARSVPMVREQTHILIAISGSVGADRLCRFAEVLNIAAKRQRLDDLEALYVPCRRDLEDLIALIAARRASTRTAG